MKLVVRQLARTDYAEALDLQVKLHERVRSDSSTEYMILVEHPPVITLGRRADESHVLFDDAELARRGFTVHHISRGGDVTYHGPGQLVGYPIIDLRRHGLGVKTYIRALEEVLMRTLARFDIQAGRVAGLTGVWVEAGGGTSIPVCPADDTGGQTFLSVPPVGQECPTSYVRQECPASSAEKVAAIGVAIRRWVSYHGFALNVNTDLSRFNAIVPCGIRGRGVTSMAKLLGERVDEWKVRLAVEEEFRRVLGFEPNPIAPERRLPPWLRKRVSLRKDGDTLGGMLDDLRLNTVCESARCPNLRECFCRGTATFMILGSVCTRRCGFCAVTKGRPAPVDDDEPARIAEAVRRMKLEHVVITSVTRDDLPDGGAPQFVNTIDAVRRVGDATVEVLVPDFGRRADRNVCPTTAQEAGHSHPTEDVPRLRFCSRALDGADRNVCPTTAQEAGHSHPTEDVPRLRFCSRASDGADTNVCPPDPMASRNACPTMNLEALDMVLDARPDVLNHNLETVPALYARVRPGADYARSLALLRRAKTSGKIQFTKSGLMLGLGETHDEVRGVLRDLREAGCDLLTLGQYLAPTREHLPVARFVHPDEFDALAEEARAMGFTGVASGPFVRSSHNAEALLRGAVKETSRPQINTPQRP